MKCTGPIVIKGDNGYMEVPCGQCIACRVNKNSDWATRIYAESRMHEDNIFLTLTYDDEHLPTGASVEVDELQKFMKRLRRLIEPDTIRFFGVGEYGGTFMRPHYHLAIFGLSGFDPRVFSGHLYDRKSKGYYVECKAWHKGLVHFGFISLRSAQYISGYVLKKVTGKKGKEHYESLGIKPEFAIMSRRPGLGLGFMDKFHDELVLNEFLVINGVKKPLPRYFQTKLNIKGSLGHEMKKDEEHRKYVEEMAFMPFDEFVKRGQKLADERQQRERNNKERYKR